MCKSPVTKETQPKPSAPVLNPTATTWTGTTGSPGERVAFQTALANVDGKKECRVQVLFDTGSQRTFITAKAVGRLGLKPVREESLGIKAFGSRETNVAKRGILELSLSSVSGGGDTVIEAFVVDDISTITNEHVEIIKQNYSHLSDVFFSDVCRYQDTLEIDVLIGAAYIWEFQNGETIRGGQHEPIAVKTTLGWVLSGPLTGEKLHILIVLMLLLIM